MRKITTKIITNRLENICRTRNILKGPNYAGLKGNSTDTPIYIVNGIMEEAKDTNRELWIVFQDMAKAFDSVGLTPLRKAIERFKIPEHMISYIIDLFDNRVIRVTTAQGLSEPFVGEDGIDQGETISPLLWRIFYDPLLCKVQNDTDLGFEISLKWPNGSIRHA